ncbi:hypothetical protein GLOIN_2v1463696 [Rhizophagus clarus]|uniref:Uncharacterized protein n=1 Tax=Rhizophagus clarus TaxID=94130 RepID=A0A8H3M5Y4_9GLOM|nr:hypothetical protein GLOIN_2v1463696 [Rhizophagus clarus]
MENCYKKTGYSPIGCRFCNLQGTLNETNKHVYYSLQQNIDPKRLPIRIHNENRTSERRIWMYSDNVYYILSCVSYDLELTPNSGNNRRDTGRFICKGESMEFQRKLIPESNEIDIGHGNYGMTNTAGFIKKFYYRHASITIVIIDRGTLGTWSYVNYLRNNLTLSVFSLFVCFW